MFDTPKVYTPEQVAQILQLSKNTVYELIKRGEIVAKKFGKVYRIPESSLSFTSKEPLAQNPERHQAPIKTRTKQHIEDVNKFVSLRDIKRKVVPILRKAGITRSSIFGSYVRGENRENSDIDMLVELPKDTGLFGFVGLKHKLEDVLNRKVDLVTYDAIHPRLRDRILREQLSIL